MLTATDPAHVKFCLDVHWVFRGCGDSQVAIFDVLEHYGERIVELHLRQSKDGVWTETFGAGGDIDYPRLAVWLRRHRIRPLLTLEQAVEAKSPRTTDAITAHRAGVRDVRALFTLRD
jgi:inosose dehydratase